MPEPLRNIITALETFAKERGGDLAIGYANGEWSVALTWGREAPDSPMAGAQAIGSDMVLEAALRQVAEEAHVELPETTAPEPITAEEAANLFAAFTGGVVDSALFDSVTPKLEVIAGKELVP